MNLIMVDKIMTMGREKGYVRNDWTIREIEYLRKHYATTPTDVLAERLNRTAKAIINRANKNGITKGRNWQQWEVDVLYKYYKTHSCPQIAEMLGRSTKGVSNKVKRLGIKKPKKVKVQKQQKGKNAKPIGTISTRLDKRSGKTYQFIKTKDGKWIPLARYVWIRHNGNIPPKYYIRFIDGDTLNCKIDNLMMITYKEHAQMNRNPKKGHVTRKRNQYNSFFESVLMGVV